jgi:hypothetical protein
LSHSSLLVVVPCGDSLQGYDKLWASEASAWCAEVTSCLHLLRMSVMRAMEEVEGEGVEELVMQHLRAYGLWKLGADDPMANVRPTPEEPPA